MVFCVNCQKNVDAQVVSGADIYGPQFKFALARYFRCPFCSNYGECAIIKDEPDFTVIPDFRLRKAYNYIDGILQLLWMQQIMSYVSVMAKMTELMYQNKKPYRTHDINSYDEACRAYKLAKKLKEESFKNVSMLT